MKMIFKSCFTKFQFIVLFTILLIWGNVLKTIPTAHAQALTEINTIEDLDDIRNNLSGNYILMRDLDFKNCNSYADCENMSKYITDEGWEPIGNWSNRFTGNFNGENHYIDNLYIDRPATDSIGLFSVIDGSNIRNLHLSNVYIVGQWGVGGITGFSINTSMIDKCSSEGKVWGRTEAAILVGGQYDSSSITNSYSSGEVESKYSSGGLLGYQQNISTVANSYFIGKVKGEGFIGGLVGSSNSSSIIMNSYSKADVTRSVGSINEEFGVFLGDIDNASVTNSYAIGNVYYEGGINPLNKGFIGIQYLGPNSLDVNNFFDEEASNQQTTAGNATPKTTVEMKNVLTYTDTLTLGLINPWDLVKYNDFDPDIPTSIWFIRDGQDYPTLFYQVFLINNLSSDIQIINISTSLSLKAEDGKAVYDPNITARIKQGIYTLSDVQIDMTSTRDWSGVQVGVDALNGKSYIKGLSAATGVLSSYKLYIPIQDLANSIGMRVCPNADNLDIVTVNCINGVDFKEGETKDIDGQSVTVSRVSIEGINYWVADGVIGTGGDKPV